MRPTEPTSTRGGRRHALAPLAAGAYLLLAGAVFYSPFLLSPYAIQNDVFLSNYFASPAFAVLGLLFILAGMVGARRRWRVWWHALLLAVVSSGVLALLYWLFGSRYYHFGETVSSEPPYLNGPVWWASVALAAATFAAGWVWSGRETAMPTAQAQ